ncbi:FAD-dependent monooxygenase [Marinomonas atlantica]|uniref:FAD-dependent monooxygenase n=1 Tax=Marinomonas atlantica TaxID=1806668 RepID=UPI000832CD69|nr:FAD-dependent monooxygenase [Marinomonas atlantica]
MNGIIIGAGIAGLSTAIALKLKGIEVDIYEASAELKVVGAGILVPPNAMAVLAHYGLADEVKSYGKEIDALRVSSFRGEPISITPSTFVNNRTQFKTVALHRGKLQEILLRNVSEERIHLGYQYSRVESTNEGLQVSFANNQQRIADFMIGADGLRSKVRQFVMPDSALRNGQQVCWRGVANIQLPESSNAQLTELWGDGTRFGFVPIGPDQVYWYATASSKRNYYFESDRAADSLRKLFSSYITCVDNIIDSTPQDLIIEGNMYDIKPLKHWFSNRVVLLGDAAHAITPNLGQGGALAIEDSYAIAEKLEHFSDPATAFLEFQQARQTRVDRVSKASWKIGQITNWRSPLLCSARNQILSKVAPMMANSQSDWLYNFEISKHSNN